MKGLKFLFFILIVFTFSLGFVGEAEATSIAYRKFFICDINIINETGIKNAYYYELSIKECAVFSKGYNSEIYFFKGKDIPPDISKCVLQTDKNYGLEINKTYRIIPKDTFFNSILKCSDIGFTNSDFISAEKPLSEAAKEIFQPEIERIKSEQAQSNMQDILIISVSLILVFILLFVIIKKSKNKKSKGR